MNQNEQDRPILNRDSIMKMAKERGIKSILKISEKSGIPYANVHPAITGKSTPYIDTAIQILQGIGLTKAEIEAVPLGSLFVIPDLQEEPAADLLPVA